MLLSHRNTDSFRFLVTGNVKTNAEALSKNSSLKLRQLIKLLAVRNLECKIFAKGVDEMVQWIRILTSLFQRT